MQGCLNIGSMYNCTYMYIDKEENLANRKATYAYWVCFYDTLSFKASLTRHGLVHYTKELNCRIFTLKTQGLKKRSKVSLVAWVPGIAILGKLGSSYGSFGHIKLGHICPETVQHKQKWYIGICNTKQGLFLSHI